MCSLYASYNSGNHEKGRKSIKFSCLMSYNSLALAPSNSNNDSHVFCIDLNKTAHLPFWRWVFSPKQQTLAYSSLLSPSMKSR